MYLKPDMEKWMDYKFGLFMHYGLYSVQGEGEWVMFEKPIARDEYAKIADRFTAEKFDAKHLCDVARRAGMKYVVLTARHHEGFCLWDSKCSIGNFTVMNTPAKRDLIREYTDACREAGLGVGLYYSPMDWRCEGFFFPLMYKESAREMRAQCHGQVRELMENYGKIDMLWYDGGEDYWLAHSKYLNGGAPHSMREEPRIVGFWGEDELNEMARTLQPGIVINNRLGMRKHGDYQTPERKVGEFNVSRPWETCDTLCESWGWTPGCRIRPMKEVIHLLTDVITGGGNLLLNVGPMADGSFQKEHEERLLEIGAWLEKYGEAVYGTRGGPVKNNVKVGGAVWKDNIVYFHIKNPEVRRVKLPLTGLDSFNGKVSCLTGEEACASFENGVLSVSIGGPRNEVETIVKIELPARVDELMQGFDPDWFNAYE